MTNTEFIITTSRRSAIQCLRFSITLAIISLPLKLWLAWIGISLSFWPMQITQVRNVVSPWLQRGFKTQTSNPIQTPTWSLFIFLASDYTNMYRYVTKSLRIFRESSNPIDTLLRSFLPQQLKSNLQSDPSSSQGIQSKRCQMRL